MRLHRRLHQPVVRAAAAVEPVREAAQVLVIDDEAAVRSRLADLLHAEWINGVFLASGGEALAYLRENEPPSLILVDLHMPRMSGWQFLRELRQQPELAEIPVAVLTALDEESAALWLKPAAVLHKPLVPGELMPLLHCFVTEGASEAEATEG